MSLWPAGQRAIKSLWQWVRHRPRLALAFVFAGLGLRIFVEVAEHLREWKLSAGDRLVFQMLRAYHIPFLNELAIGLSTLLSWPYDGLLAVPFLIYLFYFRYYVMAAALVFVPLAASGIVTLLKWSFHRDRPVTAIVGEFGYSFPSGHATGAVVFYGLLGYVAWRFTTTRRWLRGLIIVITCALILGTGLARVYLEVHYPSDVVAGWAAGACLLFGALIALETCAGTPWGSRHTSVNR